MTAIPPLHANISHTRAITTVIQPLPTSSSFRITAENKSYKHQYANIYFVRLRALRNIVEEKAHLRWKMVAGNPILIPRVLEIVKSQLCYVVGTVYMDMPLKPNVMEDIARDHSIPPPPPPLKFYSPNDNVMLEDESGRIKIVGDRLKNARLVTGVIIGALGIETPNGEFEVVDICYAEMAPQSSSGPEASRQEDEMDVDDKSIKSTSQEWIGIVSGLDIGAPSPSDAQIQMLIEFLTGEGGGADEQVSAAQISRLIIAGNSLAPIVPSGKGESAVTGEERKARRYGYDATNFSPHPMLSLSAHLLDIGRVMPIHLLPGDTDPSGTIMPQQPFPRAMFGSVATSPSFSCETNPTYLRLACDSVTRTLLINSGQPLNDIFKYLPSPPNTRLSVLESTLRWRHMAPTAPDTLWCHPYFTSDPFLIEETPDLYIVGGQQRFGTKMIVEQDREDKTNEAKKTKRCRIIMVPGFAQTGILVLVNMRSLDVKTVKFAVNRMAGGGKETHLLGELYVPTPPPAESMLSEPKSSVSPRSSMGM